VTEPYRTDKVIKKVWGRERIICNTPLYCGKILYLSKGYRCSIHHHQKKDEVFYILKGKVLLEAGGKSYAMEVGDAIRIIPYLKHRFTGITYAEILEFSTHDHPDDSYRTTQSEKCTWFKKGIIDKWRKLRGKTDEYDE
jgi:mannose-6-phosphate isomerase-like protein (cupin superfamily)